MQESVAEALRRRGAPATAQELAFSMGLHVTTVRYHLDKLVAAGAAVRGRTATAGRRGRPQFEYTIVDKIGARDEMLAALVGLVERGEGSAGAVAAGARWADAVGPLAGDAPLVIERELAERGFSPRVTPEGLELHDCPFRDEAREAPGVVCAMHLGLTQRLADRADGERVWAVDLRPFVTPTLCTVSLRRTASAA
ncbi:helix-turn-helix domain-containing protein [Demequina sp.]|uniref:helix-turn-helix domain-containing protein n=1 Tax=Demequina sp. TaxID=2050685 RepID=UPI003D0A1F9C